MSTAEKINRNGNNSRSEIKQESSSSKKKSSLPEENKNSFRENLNICQTRDINEYNTIELINDAEYNNWLSVSLALEVFLGFLGPFAETVAEKEYNIFQEFHSNEKNEKLNDNVAGEEEDAKTKLTEALKKYLNKNKISNVNIDNLEKIVNVIANQKNNKENKLELARFLVFQNNYEPSKGNDPPFTKLFLHLKYFRIVTNSITDIGISNSEFEKLSKLRAQIMCTNKQRISDIQRDFCFYVLSKILDSFEKSKFNKDLKACKENITYARVHVIKLDWTNETDQKQSEENENGDKKEKLDKLKKKIESLQKLTEKFKGLFYKVYQFESTQQ